MPHTGRPKSAGVLDDGERIRHRAEFRGFDAIELAIDALSSWIDDRPAGWRVRYATAQCQPERGNRVYAQAELVSAEWIRQRKARRDTRND